MLCCHNFTFLFVLNKNKLRGGGGGLRARGESNQVPPGSDPPTSRGPNHYANPAPESRILSGFLCTGNTASLT